MQIQKENIIDQFYEYYIYDFPIIVKKISENKFDVNYSKLVRLLHEEKSKRYNKPINNRAKNMSFKDYIKTEKLNHMNIHNKFYINTRSLRKNRWFIPPRKKIY